MKLRYDRRIVLLTLMAALPGAIAAFVLLWLGGYSTRTFLSVGLLIVTCCAFAAAWPRHRLVFRLQCLAGPPQQLLNIAFPGGTGQWQVRRGTFRQGGLPHQLVVLSDMSAPLRQQEREAWHRLIRVLGHELNNSLAPIKSIAGSLEQ